MKRIQRGVEKIRDRERDWEQVQMSFFDWLLERAAYCLHFLSETPATGVRASLL